MKGIILGEYSGLSAAMKRALEKHSNYFDRIDIAGGKDGYKNFSNYRYNIDASFFSGVLRYVEVALRYLYVYIMVTIKYDHVFIINSYFLKPKYVSYIYLFFWYVLGKNVYYLACGDDYAFIKAGKSNIFEQWVYDGNNSRLIDESYYQRFSDYLDFLAIKHFAKVTFTFSETYHTAWKQCSKQDHLLIRIPMPLIICGSSDYHSNIDDYKDENRLVVIHGRNRSNIKGTHEIRMAFDLLSKQFPEVIFEIWEPKPFATYLTDLARVDIVVDQCRGDDYNSMNAILCMALGKIVCIPNFHPRSIAVPVTSICNDPSNIAEALEALIKDPSRRNIQGQQGRKYIEDFHSDKVIAEIIDGVLNAY